MRYVSNVLRLASVTDVNHDEGIATTRWLDEATNDGPRIPIPHPYAGQSGEGLFVGLQPGSIVALGMAAYERYIPVAVIPDTMGYGDLTGIDEISFDNVGFPLLQSGDVVLQGKGGGQIRLDSDGTILVQNQFGEGSIIGGSTNENRCSIGTSAPVEYVISQSGIRAAGIVRRDVRIEEGEGNFLDFLSGIESESSLEEVGWNPGMRVATLTESKTGGGSGKTLEKLYKNPPLVEDRQIVYEFGRNWSIGTHEEELAALKSDVFTVAQPYERRQRRSNALSLSLTFPNELVERTVGTLVDVFGNILDINKNIIPVPFGSDAKKLIDNVMEKMRHSVAFHMEINTRKGWAYREGTSNTKKPITLDDPSKTIASAANNARDRSRWAFRVDKEGLTTVNIPATSETGNIPLLARHETSSVIKVNSSGEPSGERDRTEWKNLYRNTKNQDIFLDQFGPGGIAITGSSIKNRLKGKQTSWVEDSSSKITLPDTLEAGTAFHDITQTAATLLEEDANKTASGILEDTFANAALPAVSDTIDPRTPENDTLVATRDTTTGLIDGQPNAGGRSLQVNLDGSLEMSVGANTVDRVAMTLDTAGALVARLGRDRQGRSAIIHTDGSVLMEVGGWDFVGTGSSDQVDTRFVGRGESRSATLPGDKTRFRGGQVVIRVRRAKTGGDGPQNDDHLIILDDSGIAIQSAGRMNLYSKMDMTLKSKSRIILDGEIVQVYPGDRGRFIGKTGRRHIP